MSSNGWQVASFLHYFGPSNATSHMYIVHVRSIIICTARDYYTPTNHFIHTRCMLTKLFYHCRSRDSSNVLCTYRLFIAECSAIKAYDRSGQVDLKIKFTVTIVIPNILIRHPKTTVHNFCMTKNCHPK